jgi:alpha-tubulin suppressor-like RCC1 family protein
VSFELGSGTVINHATGPIPVAGGHSFKTMAVGGYHSCGITGSERLYCWGANTYGKLGVGSEQPTTVPVEVVGGHHFIAIAAGGNHSCGITDDQGAFCWGWNALGQLGIGQSRNKSVPTHVDLVFPD